MNFSSFPRRIAYILWYKLFFYFEKQAPSQKQLISALRGYSPQLTEKKYIKVELKTRLNTPHLSGTFWLGYVPPCLQTGEPK